jgi:protein phosphatase
MINDERISQITKDHSYVQELVSRGELSPEAAKNHPKKNYITRAMGAEETVKVDITIKPYNGEKVLLCSDGLTNFIDDEEIQEYINTSNTLQEGAEKLVALANERGGRDNITIVVLEKEINDNER